MTCVIARPPSFAQRSDALELMDDRDIGGAELAEALRQLRVINAVLLGDLPALEGVIRLWYAAGCPSALTILDVGAGSGDLNRLLVHWARWCGVRLTVVLVDIHPETCAAAARYWQGAPHVHIVCSDVLKLAPRCADIVTASLFTHHFADHELPAVVAAMAQAARYGVVINDLHRHPLAFAAIVLATRLLSRNRMIRNDAPLSVRRGFVARDFERLRRHKGFRQFFLSWRPFFRWLVVIETRDREQHGSHQGALST